MAWGLSWIAVGRLTDQPTSTLTGVAAAAAALIVLGAAVVRRVRPGVYGRPAPVRVVH